MKAPGEWELTPASIARLKQRAILRGRYHATTGDVRAMAEPVLRHRLVVNFNAEAAGVSADAIVRKLLEAVTPAVEDPLS